MISLNSLLLKFNDKFIENEKLNFEYRIRSIKLTIFAWICITAVSMFPYYHYIYDFEILNSKYQDDFVVILFNLLPSQIKTSLESAPVLVTFTLIILVVYQTFSNKHRIIFATLTVLTYNLNFCLTDYVASGAAVIVSNFLTYLLLLEIFVKLGQFKLCSEVKYYLMFSMKLQICLVYIVSGLVKFISPLWLNGAATYYIFNNYRYFKFQWPLQVLNEYPFLFKATTYIPLIFLLFFPILVWFKRNNWVILSSFIFHGGIAIVMGLKEFMIFPILDFILFTNKEKIEEYKTQFSKFVISFLKHPKIKWI